MNSSNRANKNTLTEEILPKEIQLHMDGGLSEKGISAKWSTMRKTPYQGFMTVTAVVQSSIGALVLHYNPEPVFEQKRVAMPKKIQSVTAFLQKNVPMLPTQKVFVAATMEDGEYYIIQEYLEGEPLGRRSLKAGGIIDSYNFPEEKAHKIQESLDQYVAKLHTLSMSGFGFLVVRDGGLRGEYDTWETFLKESSKRWFTEILDTASADKDAKLIENVHTLQLGVDALFEKYPEYLELQEGVFVHGDVVNLSNILVQDGAITGIIDFEWALSGDPAWEYTHTEFRPSHAYCEERNITTQKERELFLLRVDLSTVFWSLWGAHLHARINTYGLKEVLVERAQKYLHKLGL